MDKVKIYLAVLKKHHFWVLCAIVFITSIGVWWTGTEWMRDETKKRIGKLESVQNEAKAINGKPFQANDPTIDEVKERAIQVSRQVEGAWYKLYAAQAPRFKWPVGLREYKEICDNWEFEHPGKPFRDDVRRAYVNTMTQDLEKERLKNKIQLLTIEAAVAAAPRGLIGEGGREEPQNLVKGLVKWGSTTPGQTEVDALFNFPWLDRSILVTDLEMRYAQEDLWVYEYLLEALATVNEGCDETKPEKALLKEILSLEIGQQAAADRPVSSIMSDLSALSGVPLAAAGGEGFGAPGFPAGGGIGGRPEGGQAAAATGDAALKEFRYCDPEGKPIGAAELDTRLATMQYKLMPVVMRLAMNQKELPKLMASLANAVTPMRITQVQVYEGGGGSRVAVGADENGRAIVDIANDPRFSLEVTVEVRGMVHLFLPPNTSQFPHRLADAEKAAANGQQLGVQPGGLNQPAQVQPGFGQPGAGQPNGGQPVAQPADGQPGQPDPSAIVPAGGVPAEPPPAEPPAGTPAAAPPATAPPPAAEAAPK